MLNKKKNIESVNVYLSIYRFRKKTTAILFKKEHKLLIIFCFLGLGRTIYINPLSQYLPVNIC